MYLQMNVLMKKKEKLIEKEGTNLQDNKEGYMERFKRREGKKEIKYSYHNIRNKRNSTKE